MDLDNPIITILGDANVGKSSLYNALTKTNDAIVNNISGFTIDRKYGDALIKNYKFICVDTGSYNYHNKFSKKNPFIKKQILYVIKESNLILLIIKGDKITSIDYKIINIIRVHNKQALILINKKNKNFLDIEFYSIGFQVYLINILNKKDILKLRKILLPYIKNFYQKKRYNNIKKQNTIFYNKDIKLAIIGMPNVGKSTLVNNILNEERVITNHTPGTTRDNIIISLNKCSGFKKNIILIDTAGIRKKKINDKIEKFSIIKTFQSIKQSNIVLFMINGEKKIFCRQELSIIRYILAQRKAIIILINKTDLITFREVENIKKLIRQKFYFLPIISISAKLNKNINNIFKIVYKIYNISNQIFNTSKLMKILHLAIDNLSPPMCKGKKIKLKYIHPTKKYPLTLKIHGNQVTKLNNNYKRYLLNFFHNKLQYFGTSIILKFQENKNPYI
ncbi:ribosome biogenesis GTPase Der [Enterobacteriaceae endosymbiont of Donacia tomentosa]|uniref:ribosome biogenesis GTPase Der n=1 Tax=Enterobacteriaceae endosymbiont of Donacia tomentosa TaxID=2675787 RepID=UPI0014569FAD|nr:ribosome biogenesis GTPase Der [Enterobacteriaceae endosymbiont of Donacia tomentosa]